MQRVLVIGSGGSGKSTLATQLGKLLNLEVNHLDKIYWLPDWVEPDQKEWLKIVNELIARDSWIIDGNYSGTLALRLQRCDTVVFLDLPRLLCVWRILKRFLVYRDGTRPDAAEGCRERLNVEFFSWVWNYPRRSRPKVVRMLREHGAAKQIFWLRSRTDVQRFFTQVENTIIDNGPADACARGDTLELPLDEAPGREGGRDPRALQS